MAKKKTEVKKADSSAKTKKKSTKKAASKKATSKKATSKKAASKKATSKKAASKKATSKKDAEETKAIKEELEKVKNEKEQLKAKTDLYDIDDETIGEEDDMFNFSELENEEYENENNVLEDDVGAFDIFEHGVKLRDKGTIYPEWTIKKDGDLVATKRGSYSFDELQKEHGGGHYQIWLKDNNSKQFVKKQTTGVKDPINKTDEKEEKDFHGQAFYQKEDDTEKLLKLMGVVAQMQGSQSKDKAETAKAEAEVQNLSNQALMTMIQSMQSQSKQNTEMTLKMIQQSNESNAKMIEQLARAIKDSTSKKDEGFGLKDILALQESAKKNTAKEMKEQMEMAYQMVEQRMNMMEQGNKEEEKKSSIDKLIDTFSPVISQAVVQGQKMSQQANSNTVAPSRAREEYRSHARTKDMEEDITSPKAGNLNRPKFIGDKSRSVQNPQTTQANGPNLRESRKMPENHKALNRKEEILDLAFPIVIEGFVSQKSSKECAINTVETIEAKGISRKEILDNFQLKDIIEIAEKNSVPKDFFPRLKEYYEHIQSQCEDPTVDSGGRREPKRVDAELVDGPSA